MRVVVGAVVFSTTVHPIELAFHGKSELHSHGERTPDIQLMGQGARQASVTTTLTAVAATTFIR